MNPLERGVEQDLRPAISFDQSKPVPSNLGPRRYVVGQGIADGGTAGATGTEIYRNTLGQFCYTLGANIPIADDIYPTAQYGSDMTYLEVGVWGGGDGTGDGFKVYFQLFDDCPHGGGVPVIGTQFEAELPDDGMYLVAMDRESFPVSIPGAFWLSVSFSTDNACWIVGEPAEIGYSADLFDGSYPCIIFNGGYPANPHASFHADIFATNLGTVYEAYRADILSGFFLPLDEGESYADDIQPLGGVVTVARYEVWLAGLDGAYEVTTQLWSDSGPGFAVRPLAPILGTVGVFDGLGNGFAEQAIHELTPPVLMPTSRFWIAYSATGHDAGPIYVGDYPEIGFSGDCFSIFDVPDPGQWSECVWFCETCGFGPCCTFQARVWAVGEEPSGACCDLFANGPDCQENVPFTQCEGRWIQDATCADADFDPPCGLAACCTIDEECSDLFELDCSMVGGLWEPGKFCDVGTQACPPSACITANNDCDEPTFDSAGCNIPSCCTHVCSIDDFCCEAAWDETCVMLAADFGCEEILLADECIYAREVLCNGTLVFDNSIATDQLTDPPFSCHDFGLPHNGVGSVWGEFVATSSTARLRTCNSDGPADDSLLAVYSGTCGNLTEIACNDNASGCAATGFNSEICVSGLVPGETYYVQLASWTNEYRGRYTLELDCPATDDCGPIAPLNDGCADALFIDSGTFAFNLAGASADGDQTQIPLCNDGVGPSAPDIWYHFVPSLFTIATIDLCNGSNVDSVVMVYAGCACPLTVNELADCNDDGCGEPIIVGGPSRVSLPVEQNQCYTIRLMGTPGSGLLSLSYSVDACASSTGDCCTPQETPGCSDTNCCQAVCSCDPFCCETIWDELCAGNGLSGGCGAAVLCENQPCYVPPPPNDNCADAIFVTLGTTLFSNAAATSDGPPLPQACDETFENWISHDVWFDFVSPSTGTIAVDFCTGTDFDSSIVVYEGCDCPAQTATLVACNDDGCGDPIIVGGPSRAVFEATSGTCYKIRAGTYFSAVGGNGALSIYQANLSCPSGAVLFIDPPHGLVDARVPLGPVDHQFFRVNAPVGGLQACWSVCDTVSGELDIVNFGTPGDGTYLIILPVPIATGAVTELTYTDDVGHQTTGRFVVHPGNVNGDTFSGPTDILALIDCLNNVNPASNCPWGLYSGDINHSGQITPSDILSLIDLFNGVVGCPFVPPCPSWSQTPLPSGSCTP